MHPRTCMVAVLCALAGLAPSVRADDPPPAESSPLAGRLCDLPAQPVPPRPVREHNTYRFRGVKVEYGGAKGTLPAGVPPEADLSCISVQLTLDPDGVYYDPIIHPGPEHVCRISELGTYGDELYDSTAITAITSQITGAMRRLGIAAVLTVPGKDLTPIKIEKPAEPPNEAAKEGSKEGEGKAAPEKEGADKESAEKKPEAAGEPKPEEPKEPAEPPGAAPPASGPAEELPLRVYVGVVKQVRTMSMTAPPGEPREDLARHSWILRQSPVRAPAPGHPTGDYVNVDELDNFVLRLNRHPGRRVDVAIAPYGDYAKPENDAQITLDYLISEPEKNWSIYAQASNTGTGDTGHWRERFGFTNTNLTGEDDILRIDYLTSGFDQLHNLSGSYELPLNEKIRFRLYGTYSHFTASDVGFEGRNFEGESGEIGVEALYNFFQHRDWFFDGFVGARYQDVYTSDPTVGTTGDTNFFYPYLGVSVQRDNERATTTATASIEHQFNFVGTNGDDAVRLGRQPVNTNWTTFKFDAEQSFFLEPLLFPATFHGENLEKGQKWQPGMTLAHEIDLQLKAQYIFDDHRVIPNAEAVVGGFYSVRGYPEAVAVADSSVVGSCEYRLHIARLLKPVAADENPQYKETGAFRPRPEQIYGKADWDVILKGFVDAGATFNNDRQSFSERDQTLVGAGIGAEAQISLRDVRASVRLDWGFALHGLQDATGRSIVDEGSSRLHFSFTVLF
ncbi:MAG TPA: ShlB/FhaC/HecB family hemolysin secretion/activation protein [Phycisphaerales bacterium]|nr:ShlB/FhaC/HecB family hemolysin secretion/activation protein [Phycisphaerales bacterium]